MKKLLRILLFVLLFLFLSEPIKAKASAFELSTDTITLLEEGADNLIYGGSVPYGFIAMQFNSPVNKDYVDVMSSILQKNDLTDFDNAIVNSRRLTPQEVDDFSSLTFYDSDDNVVSLSDLFCCEVDNKYFTQQVYCLADGNIVSLQPDKGNPCINVKFGGSELSYLDWENAYNTLSSSLNQNQFNYSLDPNINLSNNGISLFYYGAYKYRNVIYGLEYVFVPNCYDVGNTVCEVYNGIPYVYTNDVSSVFKTVEGYYTGASGFNVNHSDYIINGYHYAYEIYYPQFNTAGRMSLSQFYNDSSYQIYVLDYNGFIYDSSIANQATDNIVSYKKVLNNSNTLDLSKSYSYDAISDYVGVLENLSSSTNSSFDYTDSISDVNYPLNYVIDTSVSDVVIPFPDTIVIEQNPVIDYPLDDTIDPVLITDNIPIITDLQTRFPFSIPWDIYNLISGLSVQRVAPSFDWEIDIPNYDTWEISFDLSTFDSVAELFRTCFLILFIIGLALFSYKHFFGT